ncbi:hypothetical protein GGR55DRAFT_300835 [Xylaria sp. FL0064]|nr:hypothetical protein GGR55DRAFT_300835 [Xylaria sp. FL0064]
MISCLRVKTFYSLNDKQHISTLFADTPKLCAVSVLRYRNVVRMSRNRGNRMALGDASNRVNLSPARPAIGQKKSPNDPDFMPSFAEFVAMTGANRFRTAAAAASGAAANTSKTTAGAGKKRKAETTLEEDIAAYKQNLDDVISPDEFEDEPLPSCTAVRGRINKLLDSGIMNKTEFAKAIGTNANTVSRFLQASGQMGGSGSTVYPNAWAWFRQPEYAKLKMPDVKKRQKLEADAAAASSTTSTSTSTSGKKPSSSTAKKAAATSLPDISGIYLPGEEEDDVEIYDTCDEIRRKINAHLKTPGLTQTQFCRDLYAQLKAPKCKEIQSKQLADFRAMKGPCSGARSSVFYAAYVYFEKLRVAQGKPKTAHRVNMESVWEARGGFDRETDHRTSFICLAGERPTFDQYGMTRIY